MSKKKETTFKVGRDAGTGEFKTVREAQRDKEGSIVETIHRPATTKKPTKGK